MRIRNRVRATTITSIVTGEAVGCFARFVARRKGGFVEISVDDLRGAATKVGKLADDVEPSALGGILWPSSAMPGSATCAALAQSPAAKTQAQTVMAGRYMEMKDLLTTSADTFHGTDDDAARRFGAMGDLNTGR